MRRRARSTSIVTADALVTEAFSTDAVKAALAESGPPPVQGLAATWTAGLDVGLLIIRLTLAGAFLVHGLQTVFGLLDGPGIDGFARGLADLGYRETTALAWVTGVTELVGAGLLILGLFTPMAAAALLGIVINAVLAKFDAGYFVQPANPAGYELDVLLGGMAAGLLFAGPGRIALDRGMPWFRQPLASGAFCLLLAAPLAVLTYLVFHR